MERGSSIRIYATAITKWIYKCQAVLQIWRVLHQIPEEISYPTQQQENLIAVGHVQSRLVQPGVHGMNTCGGVFLPISLHTCASTTRQCTLCKFQK